MWDHLSDLFWDIMRERRWLRRGMFLAGLALMLAFRAPVSMFALLIFVFGMCELDLLFFRSRGPKN